MKNKMTEYKKLYDQLTEMIEAAKFQIYKKKRAIYRYKVIVSKLKYMKRELKSAWTQKS